MANISEDQRLFFSCCKSGDLQDVLGMTKINPALFKVVDDLGNTALHYAAGSGKIDVVDFLLKHGQSPNAMNKRRETPLFKAAARGRADVIEMLMKAGANPELKNADGNSPIDIAGNDDCRTMLQPIREIPIVDEDDESFGDD